MSGDCAIPTPSCRQHHSTMPTVLDPLPSWKRINSPVAASLAEKAKVTPRHNARAAKRESIIRKLRSMQHSRAPQRRYTISCSLPTGTRPFSAIPRSSEVRAESTRVKLTDAEIEMSDWKPDEQKHLARSMTYIKPLNGSIGPKQTKCHITDEQEHGDFEEYISMLTTTKTPDVPSGGVFSVKTRTCLTWAGANSTKVVVTTTVEWTGKSWVKGESGPLYSS
jgi:hypothetical protein